MSTKIWTPEMLNELRRLKLEGKTNEQIATRFNATPGSIKGKWSDVLRIDQARISSNTIAKQAAAIDALNGEINHRRGTIDRLNAKVARLEQELSMATYVIQAYPQRPLWRRIWGAITGKWSAS